MSTDTYETATHSIDRNTWTQPMMMVLWRPLAWLRWRNAR